jgi:2-(1,2-epoxy-1,2-dihydrophenyl)acetyl-CoA isomerase
VSRVLVRTEGAVAWIVLNRPEVLNAWDELLERELLEALARVGDDDRVRAVGVRGAGRAFCSGGDLHALHAHAADGGAGVSRALRDRANRIVLSIRALPKPVLAVVHGSAAGVGCSFALACDLVIAAASARFDLAFIRVGLVPDGGALRWIALRAGWGLALEMALLGDGLDAQRAYELGLVNRCVADADLDAEAGELLRRLAIAPTRAIAGIKAIADAAVASGLEELLEREAALQGRMAATSDFAEGVAAFLEKRRPAFSGR